ncbi:hypothetical protein BSL78_08457 [Apostichopus japonicus]|uniref:Uncharacterized protein n=1 Tax=Stichopus japonicus TaxID=307972 RepID=A0A2G8L303_STIJA|nr:hypothetical protein BSL78_08457 [Apostichopus japonicus]
MQLTGTLDTMITPEFHEQSQLAYCEAPGQSAQEVRNIVLKDKDTTIPLALWNKSSKSPVKTGDRVTVTHVSHRNDKFLQKLALSSTNDTTIAIHVPPPSTKQGTIVALEATDGSLSVTVLTNDDKL